MNKLKTESLKLKKPENIPKEILEIDNFHQVSNIIFKLISNKATVLDIGCATGKLGQKLKQEKNCYLIGIENDEEKAKLAQSRLDKVIVADIEETNNIPLPINHFDIIVFADVLEHLKNPETILRNFKQYLKENGHVIISIPNVANWTLRLKLLCGKWDYKQRGLLDKTHVKHYTLKTAKELIQNAGYNIESLTCTSGWSRLDWKMPLKNPVNVWKSLLACNFIFKAQNSLSDSEA